VDISKLDAGVVEPEAGVFDASDLLDNLANEFQQQNKAHEVDFHYIRSQVSIHSDSQLLMRILRNFLTYVFRYTEKGRIVLGARIRKDGLAIVDKIGRILDHRIIVFSIQNTGSCFSVLIPYTSKEQRQGNKAELISEQLLQLPAKKNHILVIDNDESLCLGMQTLLQGWGCEVNNGQRNAQIEAFIENGCENKPDLIIADYHLDDGLTGLDVVQRINQLHTEGVPVLLITANYTSELRQQIREFGYHLINKPVQPVKLKLAINHL
jgi:two-component system, sensor histidine kinase